MNDAITIVIMQCCSGFKVHRLMKCMGEVGVCEGPGVI